MRHAFPVVSRLVLLAWLGLWLGAAQAVAANAPTTVLVMGDSISAGYGIDRDQGWVALLDARLDDSVKVVNASISGETTAGGATRLPDLLRQHHPDIVLLELGGNDGLRGLPPQQMQTNLARMIEASQQAGAKVALLGIEIPPNYGQAYADAFRRVYHRLADRYDVPLVPFLLEGVALNDSLMQDDGIHPTAEAQPRLLDNVWPVLEPLLPKPAVAAQE
ncbi:MULTISPECIES: arylesterase [unclassified Modicisalibacter]|uniref:arylesterase n=1 Tax=unclassified Modicisalibacter TaxID=2679913 RepID=UPI001D4203C0|nr:MULTISPECIES: arylesterase [unclassified Modicisalibacter]MBZ9557635.1 arylesterase [Modicisalibacter sp. R2A 31.J]MBZ9573701.1 arylesterase [Modicisalibacter sp. MOD 31.J]